MFSKYLFQLIFMHFILFRKQIKLKRSRSELINGKPMNNNKAKPEKKDKKKKVKETKLSYIEMKTLERRKLWSYIVKKVPINILLNFNTGLVRTID